ncbi:MAG: translation initiation factor IF-2 [Candidatus Moranbacteria bacterium]|nr:translation initiation factor IF-2 [Candidatus Moranbacteria bacterium]NTW45940.1 translation initiation factor IF-2 [Candidatus Moranbacteria bacterium]
MNETNQTDVKKVPLPATVTVKDLADRLGLPVAQVITELMKNGILATINEEVDYETASIIASDLGFEASPAEEEGSADKPLDLEGLLALCAKEKEGEKKLSPRAPIVTILGHVDHGKTTLLDTLRKASVAAGEAGGITQHLGTYQVKKRGKLITFIDTPGHEAFSAMRKRGVSIADIAILVVAADDGIQKQTKEVITYLKERNLPVIVAINKIDKPDANVARVKQELAEHDILIEEWGGKILCSEISAKQNVGIDSLLENILLVSEVEEFVADPKRSGLAVVLESHLDKQKGPVATVLVRTGTLKVGQDVVAGGVFGRIRRMEDHAGKSLETAGPSVPAVVYGFHDAPQVNDVVSVESGKASARARSQAVVSGKSLKMRAEEEEGRKYLPYILKADVQGSLEAIEQILGAIGNEEVTLEEISSGVGAVTESDVKMAAGAGAVIFAFNVEPTPVAKRIAEKDGVAIETFNIIYKLVDSAKERLADLLPPEIVRTDFGLLSVLAVFKTGKRDQIIGGRVSEGKILRNSLIEIRRGGETVGNGKLLNLQQNKQNVDEVGQGNECGLVFEGSEKVQVGDTLACYKEETRRRTL